MEPNRTTLICRLIASLLLTAMIASPGSAIGADDEATAIAAIKSLRGSVRPINAGSEMLDVAFHLHGRQLTDKELAHVAVLKNTASLNLRDTQITDAGLVHLKGLSKLQTLDLEQTDIGDKGIAHLANLVNLEYLNLYGTEITDKSLQVLARHQKLQRLYVWQTEVTDEGVAELEKTLPNLKIIRGVDLSKLPASGPGTKEPKKPTVPLKWIAVNNRQQAPEKSVSGNNTAVVFENKSKLRVNIVWITYDGGLKRYGQLGPGEMRRQNTYAKNVWLITTEDDKPLGYFVVTVDESIAVIPASVKPK
jgi:hypothetical protein